MLSDNIIALRKKKGYTQETLAEKLHVTRQTISKWERGMAVPDAEMLLRLSDALEAQVTELLGVPAEEKQEGQDGIVRQLAEINEQLAIRNRRARRIWKTVGIVLLVLVGGIVLVLLLAALLSYMPPA